MRIKKSQSQDLETWDWPVPVLNDGPGKPSPSDAYLFKRRNALIVLLEPDWYRLYWPLMSAKTVAGIRAAFSLIYETGNASVLAPLVRNSDARSSVKTARQARHELETAVKDQRNKGCEESYQKQLLVVQEAERDAYRFTEKYAEELRKDLMHRIESIRTIGIRLSQTRGELQQMRRRTNGNKEEFDDKILVLEKEIAGLEKERNADRVVFNVLKSQLDSITLDSKAIVDDHLEKQKGVLHQIKEQRDRSQQQISDLECKLQNEEASLFQSEVLHFIIQERYALTPRNLANGIAALPYMKARHSAERCVRLKSNLPIAPNQKLLDFLTSVWKGRRKRKGMSLPDWFAQEVRKMPKFRIVDEKKLPNDFRIYLCENWYHLRKAIEGSVRPPLRSTPRTITANFLKRAFGPQDPVEVVLAQQERITR
jgi:hypothetical protein